MKTRKCPKCGALPQVYIEYVDAWSTWLAKPDGTPDMDEGGTSSNSGPSGRVDARCARGHRWRLRGVWQVTELMSEVSGKVET